MSDKLVFLKLGGSLITVKDQPHTPRLEELSRLVEEIAEAQVQDPHLQILLGHGSGSYGHVAASRFNTHLGVETPAEWEGFVEVWRYAAELNHLVMAIMERAGLEAIAFPPSAMACAKDGEIKTWNLDPLKMALKNGLIPVVYGDVVFDQVLGGTILSTEALFNYLAHQLKPSRLLLAGHELGVYANFPGPYQLLHEITPESFPRIEAGLKGSAATDVTGGMLGKVRQVLSMISNDPELQAVIFSGEMPGYVRRSLLGEVLGTFIHAA